MSKFKSLLYYVSVIGGFSALIYFFFIKGTLLESSNGVTELIRENLSSWEQFKDTLFHNLSHPLAILLLQIITIILVARVLSYCCRLIGQPSVIGEIIAGIILGPSLLGYYFPEISAQLFPESSLGNLQFLSQIGLILFMFVVGMELDLGVLKSKANDAIIISHASIVIPFALGFALAYFIYEQYAPQGVAFLSFALFIGIAMSITAFPVLARIVQERGLSKTRLGALVITCAAADDITAWCLLAAVIAIVKAGSFISSLYTILLAIGYVVVMLKLIQPFLKRMGEIYSNKERLSKPIVAVFFAVLLISSFATEVIGIHALFGAFMAGVIMPFNIKFRNLFIEKVEDVSLVLLLPLFFVFTGLRTHLNLLDNPEIWHVAGYVVLVAIIGKFVGSALSARFVGQSWKNSLSIGALMNTRGLMELVVLNIGFDLGVLSAEIFTMMVIMALVTTFMTGPSLALINHLFSSKSDDHEVSIQSYSKRLQVLMSFGNPLTGVAMLRLLHQLTGQKTKNAQITALHLTPSNMLREYNVDEYEMNSFEPILSEAHELKISLEKIFKSSNNLEKDIVQTAHSADYDLLLIGVGPSVFDGTILGGVLKYVNLIVHPTLLIDLFSGADKYNKVPLFDNRVKEILKTSGLPVGVFIDKGLRELSSVLYIASDQPNELIIRVLDMTCQGDNINISIATQKSKNKLKDGYDKGIELQRKYPNRVTLMSSHEINPKQVELYDLVIMHPENWGELPEHVLPWNQMNTSLLIVKR